MRGCADRISNLPCGVIDHILSFLPLRDVVRTSTLSREWRRKWVTTPHLVFDWKFNELLNGNYELESIIDQILAIHKGDITKFSLEGSKIKQHPAIDRWLLFLSDHPIEGLALSLSYSRTPHVMPIHLFAFDHLTHLNITSGEIKLPPSFLGFSRLVKLSLAYVRFEIGVLETLLSICPMLEYLEMSNCSPFLRLDIDAPNLKCLRFWGSFNSICLKNASLEDISIGRRDVQLLEEGGLFDDSELPNSHGSNCDLIKFLGHMPSLKKLRFDSCVLKYLCEGGVPHTLLSNLNHLTLLDLDMNFEGMGNVTSALCLISSSPNLQSLRISSEIDHEEDAGDHVDAAIRYLKAQRNCNVPLSCLKNVTIYDISGLEPEMEFVKLLLLWATALEKMEIRSIFSHEPYKQDGYKLLRELTSFRRTSPKAILIFD